MAHDRRALSIGRRIAWIQTAGDRNQPPNNIGPATTPYLYPSRQQQTTIHTLEANSIIAFI
jgi:hypothetical protein